MTTQEVKRKLAAILSADVKGYSRLMGVRSTLDFHSFKIPPDLPTRGSEKTLTRA